MIAVVPHRHGKSPRNVKLKVVIRPDHSAHARHGVPRAQHGPIRIRSMQSLLTFVPRRTSRQDRLAAPLRRVRLIRPETATKPDPWTGFLRASGIKLEPYDFPVARC